MVQNLAVPLERCTADAIQLLLRCFRIGVSRSCGVLDFEEVDVLRVLVFVLCWAVPSCALS